MEGRNKDIRLIPILYLSLILGYTVLITGIRNENYGVKSDFAVNEFRIECSTNFINNAENIL